MNVEWDTEAPAIPSGNILPSHLYQALTEFAERYRPTRALRHNAYAREVVAVEADHVRPWIETSLGSLKTARSYYAEARRLLWKK